MTTENVLHESPHRALPEEATVTPPGPGAGAPAPTLRSSGRVRHDEKITVYVSPEELMALERARLELRGDLGLSVDRGRIVRAAVAMALEDLRQHGTDSELAQRLRQG